MEAAAALSYVDGFLPYLALPKDSDSKSIAKELVPRFRDVLSAYPHSLRGQVSPDFTLMDFIRRINDLSDVSIFHIGVRYPISNGTDHVFMLLSDHSF